MSLRSRAFPYLNESDGFLHYAFDKWMDRENPQVPFEATWMTSSVIVGRKMKLAGCGLTLHLQRTKILYCKDTNRKGCFPTVAFDFLGYRFQPRLAIWRGGLFGVSYLPAAGPVIPPFLTVQKCFYRWRDEGMLRTINNALVMAARALTGKQPSPTAGVIDSQSVKTTESGGIRGFDAGKKINGRKRHIVVDTFGLMVGLVIHSAGIQDRDGVPDILKPFSSAGRGYGISLLMVDT